MHAQDVIDVILPETLVGIRQGELGPETIIERVVVAVGHRRCSTESAPPPFALGRGSG